MASFSRFWRAGRECIRRSLPRDAKADFATWPCQTDGSDNQQIARAGDEVQASRALRYRPLDFVDGSRSLELIIG
jgi:hypothetical protein